ncbi:MAG: LysM peptidoglycan-binding domain-containing protein [Flavobacteriales bacterium]|nr:LysM peptidoglycan-binding domain-containing protein [Flavobacteriales bacterium]
MLKWSCFLFATAMWFCAQGQFALTDIDQSWDASLQSPHYDVAPLTKEYLSSEMKLSTSIEMESDFEKQINTVLLDDALENEVIQTLFRQNQKRYLEIMAHFDLYAPLFLKHLESNNLPEDFKYLPLVLSGLNEHYNNQYAQAGIWAIFYPTAVEYGLRIDGNYDERLHPDLSTQCFMDVMRGLQKKHDNNQLLMVAEYLKGSRWIQSRSQDEILNDPELKQFFCALKVVARLDKNFERQDQLFHWIDGLQTWQSLPLRDSISIPLLAKTFKVDIDLIKNMNPSYTGNWITKGYSRSVFLVPNQISQTEGDEILAKLEEEKKKQAKPKPAPIPDETAQTYVVRSGDVLGIIAEKLAVRVSQLKSWNNLRSDRINIGQKLVYYNANAPKPEAKKEKPTQASGTAISYTVKPGESLWLIAKKFPRVSAEDIMNWNGIDDQIQPGQQLTIYTK